MRRIAKIVAIALVLLLLALLQISVVLDVGAGYEADVYAGEHPEI